MNNLLESFSRIKSDWSISAFVCGFLVVLVGLSSSAVLVFQAASKFGVAAAYTGSWLGSLCIAMGLLTVYFSMKYRAPVLIAWSTPGAAFLVSNAQNFSLPETIGAFIFSSVLILLTGLSGVFEKINLKIPGNLISALLTGILFNFVFSAVTLAGSKFLLVSAVFITYLVAKKYFQIYTMTFVFFVGIIISLLQKNLNFSSLHTEATYFAWTVPHFSLKATVSLGLPLFFITMVTQNITGISILRSYDYAVPVSKILTKIGLVNILTALFGGFSLNFAAITSTIAVSAASNANKDKRYIAGIFSGLLYIVVGIFCRSLVSLFNSFSPELITVFTGTALFGLVGNGLQNALENREERDLALLVFLIAASGITLFNLSSVFWAILVGCTVHIILYSV